MEWSRPHAIEFAAALGLGLLGLLLLARRAARSPDARSLVLVALRASALAVLVVILLDPVRTSEERTPGERPSSVFLVDGSRSMGLEKPESRLARVERFIARGRGAVAPDRSSKVERYRFGARLSAVADMETIRPVDDRSDLRDALERLPGRFGDVPPTGVFLFSDGRGPDRGTLDDIAEGYRRMGVPIHVLPVGDPAISGDVAIRDLVVPRQAAKGARVPVKVVVGSRGFEGRRVELTIRPAVGADRRPLATLPMTLLDGDQPAELVIEADRARSGLIAEVTPLPGEAVAENNAIPFRIGARNSKLRVIYMEGSPEPEYAFIRDALVEDPDIECVAMAVDAQNSYKPRLHRVDDPSKGYPTTREELLGYDVVICSDISKAAFTQEQIDWTVELVGKRGGGFAMVGGHTSFGSGGWDRTPWDGMIPIDMSGQGPGQYSQFYNGSFQVVIPQSAESHPIWKIVDDPAKNREILARMPPFSGTNLTDRLKPAAVLLGASDRPLSGVTYQPPVNGRKRGQVPTPGGTPIFSAQTYGRGRSFAMSTDSTISWGDEFEHNWGEGDNRYFRKFWRNVVRWLAENSAGSNRSLEIATDKVIYRPGEPILVTAKPLDEKLEPTDKYRLVARLVAGPAGRPAAWSQAGPPMVADTPLTPQGDARDYATSMPVPSADRVRAQSGSALRSATVEVIAFDGADKEAARSSLDVQILDDSDEFRDPRPDPSRLEALARATGGTVLKDPEDLARLLGQDTKAADRVVTSQAPAWDSPAVLGLVFALLAAEWALRRSKGLA